MVSNFALVTYLHRSFTDNYWTLQLFAKLTNVIAWLVIYGLFVLFNYYKLTLNFYSVTIHIYGAIYMYCAMLMLLLLSESFLPSGIAIKAGQCLAQCYMWQLWFCFVCAVHGSGCGRWLSWDCIAELYYQKLQNGLASLAVFVSALVALLPLRIPSEQSWALCASTTVT